jgi:hypothetical protein
MEQHRVVEADTQCRQYRVKIDGSRRVTISNRRFLKRINPVCRLLRIPAAPVPDDVPNAAPIAVVPAEQRQMPATQLGRASAMKRRLFDGPQVAPAVATRYSDIVRRSLEPHQVQQQAGGSAELAPVPRELQTLQPVMVERPLVVVNNEMPSQDNVPVRQSSRIRKPAVAFSPKMAGKSHR